MALMRRLRAQSGRVRSGFAGEALATARELLRNANAGSGPWLPETGRALWPHGSQHVT